VPLAALAAAGCIPSYPLEEGQLDRYWSLAPDDSEQVPFRDLSVADKKVPYRWMIYQRRSVIWSTVAIVRAVDRLREGVEEIALAISPAHTRMLTEILAEARLSISQLARIAEAEEQPGQKRWAEAVADTLVRIERILRRAHVDEDPLAPDGEGEPAGLAAGPILHMVALYLDEETGGALLDDMEAEETQRLRKVLLQVMLKLSFAVAGKQEPPELRDEVVALARRAADLDVLERQLRSVLSDGLRKAPPAAPGSELRLLLQTALTWTPRALRLLESFLAQWDRMQSIQLDFRGTEQQPVFVFTVRVRQGKEVRLEKLIGVQPEIVFRGTSKIVVRPSVPETEETVVSFEPIDGAVDIRFEGVLYGLARVFAFPLANAALREVRVYNHAASRGDQIIHVAMLMEAYGDRTDPRRMIVFQDRRHRSLSRGVFSLRSIDEKTEQTFSYLTPQRRYTYRRVKGPEAK
jgi:hypothetical protein